MSNNAREIKEELERLKEENIHLKQQIEFSKKFMEGANYWETFRDKNGKIIYLSPSFEAVLGERKEAYLNGEMNISAFIHQDDIAKTIDYYKQTLQGLNVAPHKCRINDNWAFKYVLIDYKRVLDIDGQFLGIRTCISDITELEKREQNLRLIVEHIPALVGQINHELKYVYVNKMYELYSGIEEHNIIGKNVKDVITEDTFKISHPFMLRALAGEFVSFETRHKSHLGEDLILRANFVPNIENDQVENFFVVAWNITDIKKSELIIEKQNEQLKELNATKDRFFSIIAHDLRGPFNNILGFSDLLSENINEFNTEESKRFSNIIHSTARSSLTLLDNLLNWAKSQTDTIKYLPEKLNISEIINSSIEATLPMAKIKKISINKNLPEVLYGYVDENMVKLVLRNLISNAIKFTKPGGIIRVSANAVQDHVEVSVSDNGVGMSNEKREKLFNIYTNTTSPGTSNEKGTGLGLVLCKEFVEKLGGKIWAESVEGKGSDFKFTLPADVNSRS